MNLDSIFAALDLEPACRQGGDRAVFTPIDGSEIARVASDDATTTAQKIAVAEAAFADWRIVPAPRRGELIRLLGEELRTHKEDLGRLVTLESGKILQEGMGEVQEMIDICDFALGLSRQLYGKTIATERPGHRMMETWHPMGPCGVITAFNFPVAVWAWNAAIALVCGNSVIWKPSEKTPISALASHALFAKALKRFGPAPDGLSQVLIGGRECGERLADDPRLKLISATGSTRMGREVAPRVAARFGRSILELGGRLAFGSDAPVESPDPFAGLAAAITRTDADGEPFGGWRPEERVNREQALAGFTSDAAFAGFAEGRFGRLLPGERADFVLIDRDPMLASPAELRETRVLETWVGGRKVYEAD